MNTVKQVENEVKKSQTKTQRKEMIEEGERRGEVEEVSSKDIGDRTETRAETPGKENEVEYVLAKNPKDRVKGVEEEGALFLRELPRQILPMLKGKDILIY